MYYLSNCFKPEDLLSKKQREYSKWIKKIILLYIMRIKKYVIKEEGNDKLVYLANSNTKKLIQYLSKNNVDRVCLSTGLYTNKDFISNLNNINNLQILDGKTLFKYLIPKIIEYIYNEESVDISKEEIAILCNNVDEIVLKSIELIAHKVKIVHIITNKPHQYNNFENKMFDEKGININICNNYNKSLAKINTIINYDFSAEEINKYKIYKYAVIINNNYEIKIKLKSFEGISINGFSIFTPKRYINQNLYLDGYDANILYESYLFKKNNIIARFNQIKLDNIKIATLKGNNGNIRKNEYERLVKNRKKYLTKHK